MEQELVEKITKEFNEAGVDDVNIRVSQFLGEPWLYILFYHKGRGIIYDMSVATYKQYGIMIRLLKDEWQKKWKEIW